MKRLNKRLYDFFWEYFLEAERKLINLEELNFREREEIFIELQTRLMLVDRNLGFEISRRKGLRREIVITANGLTELFPLVREIVEAAPDFDIWDIKAFKQRIDMSFGIRIGDIDVTADDIYFKITKNEGDENLLDLVVYLENKDRIPEFKQREIIYQLLDGIIGEEDVEMCIGVIDESDVKDETYVRRGGLVYEVDKQKRVRKN